MPTPDLTVVVATIPERGASLGRTLSTLAASGAAGLEVLVVSEQPDASGALPALPGGTIAAVPAPDRRLSVKRNEGVRAAAAGIVAFLDDDMEVLPGWADGYRRAFEEPALGIAGGTILPRWEAPPPAGFAPFLREIGAVNECEDPPWSEPWVMGGNFAARREVFRAVGGFSPLLGRGAAFPAGEESDLVERASTRFLCRRVPGAAVRHFVEAGRFTEGFLRERYATNGAVDAARDRLLRPGGRGRSLRGRLRNVLRLAHHAIPAAVPGGILHRASLSYARGYLRGARRAAAMAGEGSFYPASL